MSGRLFVVTVAALLGCRSGHASSPTVPPRPVAACPREPKTTPNAPIVYGVVVDEHRHPLAGVSVDGARWQDVGGTPPRRTASVHAVSDATGRYELRAPLGALRITATWSGRTVVAAGLQVALNATHVDLVIDTTKPPGSITAFDARIDQSTTPCTWVCPIDRVPVAEWWRRAHPCPDGASPTVELDDQKGITSISCRTPSGEAHGAYSTWLPSYDTGGPWQESTGWYFHGERCGMWHEPGHDGSCTLSKPSGEDDDMGIEEPGPGTEVHDLK